MMLASFSHESGIPNWEGLIGSKIPECTKHTSKQMPWVYPVGGGGGGYGQFGKWLERNLMYTVMLLMLSLKKVHRFSHTVHS